FRRRAVVDPREAALQIPAVTALIPDEIVPGLLPEPAAHPVVSRWMHGGKTALPLAGDKDGSPDAAPALQILAVDPVAAEKPHRAERAVAGHDVARKMYRVFLGKTTAGIPLGQRPEEHERRHQPSPGDRRHLGVEPAEKRRIDPDWLLPLKSPLAAGVDRARPPLGHHALDRRKPLLLSLVEIPLPVLWLCFQQAVPSCVCQPKEGRAVLVYKVGPLLGHAQRPVPVEGIGASVGQDAKLRTVTKPLRLGPVRNLQLVLPHPRLSSVHAKAPDAAAIPKGGDRQRPARRRRELNPCLHPLQRIVIQAWAFKNAFKEVGKGCPLDQQQFLLIFDHSKGIPASTLN